MVLAGIAGLRAAAAEDAPPTPPPQAVEATKEQKLSVVRVNVTNQAYDFFHPWTKKAPFSRRAIGVLLPNKRLLVTAEMVANATFLELEKAESGEKIAAEVEVVDYEANLALIRAADDKFLTGLKPITVEDGEVGDRVSVWQLESTGALLITSGLLTTVEVSPYPIGSASFLTYDVTTSLQYREGSFTVPVVKDNALVGLLMRYDPRSQNAEVIAAPVIEHFLKEAAKGKYSGFPRAGFQFSAMRDPQLREYLGIKNSVSGGVYVHHVLKDSPAAAAGLQKGDVLLAIDDAAIDQDGNYADKTYGKLSLSHLLSTRSFHGDKRKLKLWRKDGNVTLDLTVLHEPATKSLIPAYVLDTAPRYVIIGGVVLQELSRQYLREWGDWRKKAPERFVYYDEYQGEIFADDPRERIVILSHVLPTGATVGYEDMSYLVVSKLNGVALKSLADVPAALEKPDGGFHKIEFDEPPKMIFLDVKQVEAEREALLQSYGIPAISHLE